MTANEIREEVSRRTVSWNTGNGDGVWWFDGLQIPVTVKDVREVYGNVQVLITPVNGQGRKWVRVDSLMMKNSAVIEKYKGVGRL